MRRRWGNRRGCLLLLLPLSLFLSLLVLLFLVHRLRNVKDGECCFRQRIVQEHDPALFWRLQGEFRQVTVALCILFSRQVVEKSLVEILFPLLFLLGCSYGIVRGRGASNARAARRWARVTRRRVCRGARSCLLQQRGLLLLLLLLVLVMADYLSLKGIKETEAGDQILREINGSWSSVVWIIGDIEDWEHKWVLNSLMVNIWEFLSGRGGGSHCMTGHEIGRAHV